MDPQAVQASLGVKPGAKPAQNAAPAPAAKPPGTKSFDAKTDSPSVAASGVN
jgi:hypothetical protein